MICVLSTLVFGFLGIFFSHYRELARESFNCMVDRVKTGECDADFETELRSTIVAGAMERDPRLAKFLNDHLDKIALVLLLVLLVAGTYTVMGLYNYLVYGNCDPGTSGCAYSSAGNFLDSINPFTRKEVILPGNYSG